MGVLWAPGLMHTRVSQEIELLSRVNNNANFSTVGALNKLVSGNRLPVSFSKRVMIRSALIEFPPTSKKSSYNPKLSTPKYSLQMAATNFSVSVTGGINALFLFL